MSKQKEEVDKLSSAALPENFRSSCTVSTLRSKIFCRLASNNFSTSSNSRGFTLIEILLVFAMIAILGTAAVSNYMSTTRTFEFLNKYKEVVATLRNVRTYAVANKQLEPEMSRYGIEIKAQAITVFADTGKNPYELDTGEIPDKILANESLNFAGSDFEISIGDNLDPPVYLFYENGSGDLKIYHKGVLLDKKTQKYLHLKFFEGEAQARYIEIYYISGLIEAFNENKEL